MAETVIVLAPGEEQIIRVRCAAPEAPGMAEVEVPEEEAPVPANIPAPGNLGAPSRMPITSRKSRKNRKNTGATRKQSGGKRGMNPFMKFASKERKNIMSSNPGMAVTEVGKELGKRWRALSEAEKKKYSA